MTQKHSFVRYMSIIVALMMISMATILSGCSKEKEEPEPPKAKYFIQEFFEGYLVMLSMFNGDGTRMNARIDQNFCWLLEKPILYSATSNPATYKSLLNFYGDTGIDRELKSAEKKYLPHMSGIEWLKCDVQIVDSITNDTTIVTLPDPEYITVKFKTYYPYIKNGYKWPNGMNEWQEMSIKEFNRTGPHYLLDVNEEISFRRDTSTGADKEVWDRKPEQIKVWFKFDSGVQLAVYWLLPQYYLSLTD